MDLSIYYNNFGRTIKIAIFVVCLAFFVVTFCCVRTILDKSKECNRVWKKTLFCIGYASIFIIVLYYYFCGPYLYKKDIDQKTIYGYEGTFEIGKIDEGIYNYAMFYIDGQELRLKFFKDDGYNAKIIKTGKYEGKVVYAQNAAKVLYIEIYQTEE